MPTIDYDKLFRDLMGAIADPVKQHIKDVLANNQEAIDFIEGRAKRLAELGVEYVKATTDDRRNAVLLQIKVVQQTIENEITSVALSESIVARGVFKKIVATAVDVLVKLIPVIIQAI